MPRSWTDRPERRLVEMEAATECKAPDLNEWGTMCTRPPGHSGAHENKRTRAVWHGGERTTSGAFVRIRSIEPGAGDVSLALVSILGHPAVLRVEIDNDAEGEAWVVDLDPVQAGALKGGIEDWLYAVTGNRGGPWAADRG